MSDKERIQELEARLLALVEAAADIVTSINEPQDDGDCGCVFLSDLQDLTLEIKYARALMQPTNIHEAR